MNIPEKKVSVRVEPKNFEYKIDAIYNFLVLN